jgi:DNA polymerase III delta prime subunit
MWFEKYRPTDMEHIIVPTSMIRDIDNWFTSFEQGKSEKLALLFLGPPGLGKTSLAHIILKRRGYTIKEFNASDVRGKTEINQIMMDLTRIDSLKTRKIAIIMDEVDGMATGERGGLGELIPFITPSTSRRKKKMASPSTSRVPVICICNTGTTKKATISTLSGVCHVVNFTRPTFGGMKTIINNISSREGFSLSPDIEELIIKFSQGDFRRLVSILQHIYETGSWTDIDNVAASCKIFCKKEQDLHITHSILHLMNNNLTFSNNFRIYQKDKSKAPMVMHENYVSAIALQEAPLAKQLENALQCIDSIVISDNIDKKMYGSRNWNLQLMQGISCCYIPSYYINIYKKREVMKDVKWTDVLSKTNYTNSTQGAVNDILHKSSKDGSEDPLLNSTDVQNLAKRIMEQVLSQKSQGPGSPLEGVKLLISHGLDFSDIDKLKRCVRLSDYSSRWDRKTALQSTIHQLCDKLAHKHDIIERTEGVEKIFVEDSRKPRTTEGDTEGEAAKKAKPTKCTTKAKAKAKVVPAATKKPDQSPPIEKKTIKITKKSPVEEPAMICKKTGRKIIIIKKEVPKT